MRQNAEDALRQKLIDQIKRNKKEKLRVEKEKLKAIKALKKTKFTSVG